MTEKEDLVRLINELLDQRIGAVELESPEDPPGMMAGPLTDALDSLADYQDVLFGINVFLANHNNQVTRSDVYILMAELVDVAVANGEGWTAGSENSWTATAQAYRTRAAELGPDTMTVTKVPWFGPGKFGAGEQCVNYLSLIVRRFVGCLEDYSKDWDKGPNDEPLTVAECIHIHHQIFRWLEKSDIVSFEPGTAFDLVKDELYNQYKALGDSIFGPIHIPGGEFPWSWAG